MNQQFQKKGLFLTDAQLRSEMMRCEFCEEKPCRDNCPAGCSPADFIMAAREMRPSDFQRAAGIILKHNPYGGVCGLVCPEKHCMSGCSKKLFDNPINIPAIQATIIQKAKELDKMPEFTPCELNGKKVAVIGAGPAGISAGAMLRQHGYEVTIFESEEIPGGSCSIIPEHRLGGKTICSDTSFWMKIPGFTIKYNEKINCPVELKKQGYEFVIDCVGVWDPILPGIEGENLVETGNKYLQKKPAVNGRVAVYGGGAVAVDCAVTAKKSGAEIVEMFFLESVAEMPLTKAEREEILHYGIELNPRTKIVKVHEENNTTSLCTSKVQLKDNSKGFSIQNIEECPETKICRKGFSKVIFALGNKAGFKLEKHDGIFYAGDCWTGASTVVEAASSGKIAALMALGKMEEPKNREEKLACDAEIPGFNPVPVSLKTDFFGREIISPFLLSAAPPSDGFEQMKLAYEAGWAGGVMKTTFAKGPIHIPGKYMHFYDKETYGNCDNVSGHLMDRVEKEIAELVKLYPDRLTIASTGGPVSGNDEADKKGWQENTTRLEKAGAMAIEYSLSCPQGGDGTEGDIVSQNAKLTQKIIGWIMEVSNPEIPKLFKLTGAVTSIALIVKAIKEVLDQYPGKKAGITLANTFPTMDFRPGNKKEWEEGILFGMSGKGALPISYLSLAMAANIGVTISGNGGPMNYKDSANFLALGVNTVQFCTIAMKNGVNIVKELENGLAYLMQDRGIKSVKDLIGIAHKDGAITDFMALTPVKMISAVNEDLCEHCGNCSRCSYFGIKMNDKKIPEINAETCIGCSICVQKCFAGALYMRERTPEELAVLKED